MTAYDLHCAVAAVAPIDGVSIGNPADKSTWQIWFKPTATAAQRAAALAVVGGTITPPKPVPPAGTQREANNLVAVGIVTKVGP